MTTRRVLTITGIMIAVTAIALLVAGWSGGDALMLTVAPGCAALAVGGLGATLLDRFRHRPFARQISVVTFTAVGAVAAGALVSTLTTMSVSTDEVVALLVAIVLAATVGIVTGLALSARVMRAAELLQDAARHVGSRDERRTESVDIEELAVVSDELESAAERVVAERARRQLISWVSHDLRSPLAGISAIADSLVDAVDRPPIEEDAIARHVRRLRMETDRITKLVDDLAQLSEMESGRAHLRFDHDVSLSDLLSDAVAAAQPVAEWRGVGLRAEVINPPPAARLAANEVSRVLTNLLDNAVRATPRGGTVKVALDSSEHAAVVAITDECGGNDRRGERSAGLGLVIAQGFIDAHRGELSVSEEAGGCRHVVRLPLAPPSGHP